MKYLKKIFENDLYNQVDEVELRDFCETYLISQSFLPVRLLYRLKLGKVSINNMILVTSQLDYKLY